MNEVIIVVRPGDTVNNIIATAIEIVKIRTVSYVMIEFNEVKFFVLKDSTKESAYIEYTKKLKEVI